MRIWIDAQLSPDISKWIQQEFLIDCIHVREIGLLKAKDEEIFFRAWEQNAIIMTKDIDFVNLLEKYHPPPKVIWLTCGNTSNQNLKQILNSTLQKAIEVLEQSEALVEIK